MTNRNLNHKFFIRNLDYMIFCIFFFLIFLLVKVDFINFTFMPQAKVLLDIDTNLFHWFAKGHMHAIRLLVAYPGFIVSEVLNISLDEGYTYWVAFIMFLLGIVLYKTTKIYCDRNEFYILNGSLILVCVVGLSIVMNGRINFAFLGMSLLLYYATMLKKDLQLSKFRQLIIILITIPLSAVSSGTLVVLQCFMLVIIILNIKNKKAIFNIGVIVAYLPFLFIIVLPLIKYVLRMINKNITFFGGGFTGIINMLQHGMGRILPVDNKVIVILLVFIAFEAIMLNYIILLKIHRTDIFYIFTAINIGVYGSMFGISTGTVICVPVIVLLCVFIDRSVIIKKEVIDGKQSCS